MMAAEIPTQKRGIPVKEKLDRFLNKILQEKHIAGFSLAITDRHQVLYSGGFGLMDAEQASSATQAETIYRIASITKIVTGMVILKLWEENRLSLTEPVITYIPWLREIPNWKKDITLTHLLSHTAGLPVEYTPDGPRDEGLLEESLKKELLEIPEIPDEENRGYLYSNLGIRLASLAAQNVTGKPYSVLAREYVLDPLGMTQTDFDRKKLWECPVSFPHTYGDGGFEVSHYIMENAVRLAAGGLSSNVLDLSKLARCILNEGKPVLSAPGMAEMQQQHARVAEGRGYGLTTQIFAYPDGVLYGHLGNAYPYGGSLLVDMEKGIGVCLLMNTFDDGLRTELTKEIFALLKEE